MGLLHKHITMFGLEVVPFERATLMSLVVINYFTIVL